MAEPRGGGMVPPKPKDGGLDTFLKRVVEKPVEKPKEDKNK